MGNKVNISGNDKAGILYWYECGVNLTPKSGISYRNDQVRGAI